MKEHEQHIGFEDSEVRDFLAQSLLRIYTDSVKNHAKKSDDVKKIYVGADRTPLDYAERAVKCSAIEVEYANEIHRLNKLKLGVLIIMNERGWTEHDLGDYLEGATYPYLNFIGTKEEAEVLIEQFKNK